MTMVIRTEDVWKTYSLGSPRQVDAVKGASIEIPKGVITGFGGPSGSGKTTLLSLIGLLTKPSKGKVFIEDKELSALSEVFRTKFRRERIGFIFQAQYLIPQLTATENVAIPKLCTDTSRGEAERLAKEKLSGLGLGHRLDFRVAELSGGEQQRVSIARSLMNSPEILIADEPSSSIEEALTKDLLATLRDMVDRDELTVIVASHDPLVLGWCDRLYTMRDGEIVI